MGATPLGKPKWPLELLHDATVGWFQVDNTDFEGRLILVDAMWYAQQVCKPRALLDMATLTCEWGSSQLAPSTSRD